MSDEIEIIDGAGSRSFVLVEDLPQDVSDEVRLVRTRNGVRIEPRAVGALLDIDGREMFSKDLRPGERAMVRGVWIRLLGSKAPPRAPVDGLATEPTMPVAPSRPVVEPASRRAARRRSGRRTSLLPALSITALVVVAAVLAYRQFHDSSWPQTPQHYVELARNQYENNRPERALDTLAFALREASGETREQALALEADIRRLLLQNAAALSVAKARREQALIDSFVDRYLTDATRPAARECVRLCDAWLAMHREACSVHPDGPPLVARVEAVRDRYAAIAAMSTPDNAADVVFAAEAQMRFVWRDYKTAVARLDAFLAAHPDDAVVLEARRRLLEDGREWLDQKLRRLDGALDRGDVTNADKDLDSLERWVAIEPWADEIAARRRRLESMR